MVKSWLSSPLKIGSTLIANRIVIPAIHTNLASPEGTVTEAMITHYQNRASGGAGMIMVEVATVQYPLGRQSLYDLRIDNAACLPGLTRLASAIKHTGCVGMLQLFHAGGQTSSDVNGGYTPISPSAVPIRVTGVHPRALSTDEIEDLRARFIQAGIWAAEAGFAGVELHAAHGYLLSEFLSPLTNQRSDRYGGSREHRCRLLTEVISGIKQHCPRLIISVRINGDDFLPGGINPEEAARTAMLLEQAGADLINVSAGMYDSGLTSIESKAYPEGWRLYLSSAVKAAVSIPVIGGGVISEPATAEKALADGMCDLIYIGRASMADYDWPRKALAGEDDLIRPCIRCNHCVDRSFAGGPLRCAVNPELGGPPDSRDSGGIKGSYYWVNAQSASHQEKSPVDILVVGSGPAGMTAALTAARQGHRVILAEKADDLGGLLELASQAPHKERIAHFRRYLIREILNEPGINILTGQNIDADWIRLHHPDVIVAALGSRQLPAPNINSDKIALLSIDEVFKGNYSGKRCLVVGGGETGLEAAQVLALKGAVVTVIEKSGQLAGSMEKKNRRSLLNSLKELPVTTYTNTTIAKLEENQALLAAQQGTHYVTIDCLLPAWGREPRPIPQDWLNLNIPILVIGDAAAVGSIATATRSAYLALHKFTL